MPRDYANKNAFFSLVLKLSWISNLAILFLACEPSDLPFDSVEPDTPPKYSCIDPKTCCAEDKLKCFGDPDSNVTCFCEGLWNCAQNPEKCEALLPTPDGGSGWECEWTEFNYSCKKSGEEEQSPTGDSDWQCEWQPDTNTWICMLTPPPVPPQQPEGEGSWKCEARGYKLICTPGVILPPVPLVKSKTPPPVIPIDETKPTPAPVPVEKHVWQCKDDICKKQGDLPANGDHWQCHQVTKNNSAIWICVGPKKAETAPGGNGWQCLPMSGSNGYYRCEKSQGKDDLPPGSGYWSCARGTEFNGTKCEKVLNKPQPPLLYPRPNETCEPGQRRWCDGLIFCGWGQVLCDASTKTWKTKLVNGKVQFDCQEGLAGGKVPLTICGCYHSFFNSQCCERSDCVLPSGTNGQICPKSPGKLCDYCHAFKSECTEPGAKCIISNQKETFCGRDCSSSPCPVGFKCTLVKSKTQYFKQCMPKDMSCYF